MSNAATATVPVPVASPGAGVVRRDFPAWLPPMLVKELRQGLQTKGFVAAFILFQAIMVIMMAGTLAGLPDANPAARAAAVSSSNAFFWALMSALLLLVIPGRALAGLKGEIDSRTLDLLVLTRLTAWRIVLGKWGSLVAQGALLLVAMLPYGIARYFAGSVDLFSDGQTCLALLGGCALLCGLGLWLSVLPRVAMFTLLIGGFFYYINANNLSRSISRMAATGSISLGMPADSAGLLVVDGVVILVFFLIAAVRRIAPPAENHAPSLRLLALATLASVPVIDWLGRTPTAQFQFLFATSFLVAVAAIELASVRRPMAVHWRTFVRRGRLSCMLGRLLLPGWPSALLFTILGSCCYFWTVWGSTVLSPSQKEHIWYLAPLALGALVFPAVLVSLVRNTKSNTFALYGLFIGVFSLVAALTYAFTGTAFMPRWWPNLAALLPVTGFWLTFGKPLPDWVSFGQIVVVCGVLVAAWIQARKYWHELAEFDALERSQL